MPPARALTRDEALAKLTRRYFTSHGPATVKDFVWWSGLTVKDTRAGLDSIGARSEQVDGLTLWHVPGPRLKVPSADGSAHLLPNYDEYLVAYKDRRFVVPPSFKTTVAEQRMDIFAHFLIVDGRLAGTWRRIIGHDVVRVSVELHAPLGAPARQAVQDAANRLGVFHGMKVELKFVGRR